MRPNKGVDGLNFEEAKSMLKITIRTEAQRHYGKKTIGDADSCVLPIVWRKGFGTINGLRNRIFQ